MVYGTIYGTNRTLDTGHQHNCYHTRSMYVWYYLRYTPDGHRHDDVLISVVYRFFTPPLAGIGKLLALAGRYFRFGITVHVIFCLSYGFH